MKKTEEGKKEEKGVEGKKRKEEKWGGYSEWRRGNRLLLKQDIRGKIKDYREVRSERCFVIVKKRREGVRLELVEGKRTLGENRVLYYYFWEKEKSVTEKGMMKRMI